MTQSTANNNFNTNTIVKKTALDNIIPVTTKNQDLMQGVYSSNGNAKGGWTTKNKHGSYIQYK